MTTLILVSRWAYNAVGCKRNLHIDNGHVTYKRERPTLVCVLVAYFDCDDGYFLLGPDIRYCGTDLFGTRVFWDYKLTPYCKGMEI